MSELRLVEFGKKRANPLACPPNILKLEAQNCCDYSSENACKDGIEIPVAAQIKGVTFEGVYYDVNIPHNYPNGEALLPVTGLITASDVAKVEEYLSKIAQVREFDIWVNVKSDGTNVTICHVGRCTLESVTLSDDSVVAATRCCDTAITIKYVSSGVGAGQVLDIDGNTVTLDLTYTDGDDAANTAIATAAETAINAFLAANSAGMGATVTVNAAGVYDIELYSASEAVTLGGRDMINCGSSETFVCP